MKISFAAASYGVKPTTVLRPPSPAKRELKPNEAVPGSPFSNLFDAAELKTT